jgi:hypothetical protein
MESVIWCILGFILIVLSLTLICFWQIKEKTGKIWAYCYITWLMGFLGILFISGFVASKPMHAKDVKLTTEIRQELLNGKIISTDTIYKFTLKKK